MPVASILRQIRYGQLQSARRRQYTVATESNSDNATNEADHAEASGESADQSEGPARTSAASG